MATPWPITVDTDCSRSSMASTYDGSTASMSTSSCPAARIASSAPAAAASSWIPLSSSSAPAVVESSDIDLLAILDCIDDLGHSGIAQEHLEGNDRHTGHDSARPVGQPFVAYDEVSIVRNGVHGGVLHRHATLLQLPSKRAGQHHAAPHAGIACDDELAYV